MVLNNFCLAHGPFRTLLYVDSSQLLISNVWSWYVFWNVWSHYSSSLMYILHRITDRYEVSLISLETKSTSEHIWKIMVWAGQISDDHWMLPIFVFSPIIDDQTLNTGFVGFCCDRYLLVVPWGCLIQNRVICKSQWVPVIVWLY